MHIFLSLFLSLIFVSPAFGHKIRVFAYQEGAHIITETRFSGGRAAQGAEVKAVVNGKSISTGTTDTHGIYQFPIPHTLLQNPVDIDVIAQTDDGHKAHWTLLADDISTVEDTVQTKPQVQNTIEKVARAPKAVTLETVPLLTENAIRSIVQEELAKGLAPINRELSQDKPNLQDILGGLGYIFGLLGIAAFFTSRRRQ